MRRIFTGCTVALLLTFTPDAGAQDFQATRRELSDSAKKLRRATHVGGKGDRFEVTIPKAPNAVFPFILRVLADSNYTIKMAERDAGLIQTEVRDKSFLTQGKGFRETMLFAAYHSMKLDFTLTAVGTDSTRMTIRGTTWDRTRAQSSLAPNIRVTTKDENWDLVWWIGAAILAAVTPEAAPTSVAPTSAP